jgi:hypothetical protein
MMILQNYKGISGSIVKTTSGSTAGYRLFRLDPPAAAYLIVAQQGKPSTYSYFAIILESFTGDADLYLYTANPPYYPASDGSNCCDSWGTCATTNQANLWGTSCKGSGQTENMQLSWQTVTPYSLYFVVAGYAPTSLYRITAVYYNLLDSSIALTVPSSAATTGASLMFWFKSDFNAYGFIIFADPTTAVLSDPDVYVKGWNFTDWPSQTNYVAAGTSEGRDLVMITGNNYSPGQEYAILVNSRVGGAYSVLAANLFIIYPGVPVLGHHATRWTDLLPLFRSGWDGQSGYCLDCQRRAGSGPLRQQQAVPPGGILPVDCNCAYVSSTNSDDSIHLDWLDPEWSDLLYIAVRGFTSSNFPPYCLPPDVYGRGDALPPDHQLCEQHFPTVWRGPQPWRTVYSQWPSRE